MGVALREVYECGLARGRKERGGEEGGAYTSRHRRMDGADGWDRGVSPQPYVLL